MKKLLALTAGLIAALSTVAMAEKTVKPAINFNIQEHAQGFAVVGTAASDTDFRALKVDLQFNKAVVIPVSKTTGSEANIAGGTVKTPVEYATASVWSEDDEDYINVTADSTPGFPKWTDDGDGIYTLNFEEYTTNFFDCDGVKVFAMVFKYADGKGFDDLNGNLSVELCQFQTGTSPMTSYTKGADGCTLTVTESWIVEPVDPIKMTGEVGIRSDAPETTGIRFVGSTATANKDTVKEYGFIAAIESDKSGLKGTAYTVDLDLVAAGKAAKGVAFNKEDGTDIVYDVAGEDTIITCIVNGMPINAKSVKTDIAVRAYIVLADGTTVYSLNTTKDSAYDVAYAIKAAGGSEYTENQAYIDEILAQDESKEVPIDLSPLFE